MIKFAALTPSLMQPGGAERTILIQLRYSDPKRMQCTGIALSGHGGLDEALGLELLKHTTLHGDVPKGRWQRTGLPIVKTDYNNLNEAVTHICRDADVLVTWGSLAMGVHTTGLGIPVVCVSHCSASSSAKITGITHLVAVSKAARAFFATAPGAKSLPMEIIPNGVEIDRTCPIRGRAWQREQWGVSASDRVLLYLGRHHPDKNPVGAVRVLTKLPSEYKLIMVGNQANDPTMPHPDVVEAITKLGLEDRVKCLPPVPYVGDVLAGADCLVHLSVREADSLVVKEAFLVGLPIVYTPVGAIPEMEAEFGQVGWRVDFKEGRRDPASIDTGQSADQIKLAFSDVAKPVADKMRTLAWEHWTGPAMCERWANYLEKIVGAWTYPPGWGPESHVRRPPELPPVDPLSPQPPSPKGLGVQNAVVYKATDPTKARSMPAEIVFPSHQVFKEYYIEWSYNDLVTYVVKLAKGLAHDVWRLDGKKPMAPHSERGFPPINVDTTVRTVVRESADLKPIDWSSFPILVDGVEVVVDFGDWNIVRAGAAEHAHWLRFHFHSSYKSYPWLGAFPPPTFMDWAYYDRIQQHIRDHRDPYRVTTILNNQNAGPFRDSRRRRRFMVRGMLHHDFGDRVDFSWSSAEAFHAKAEHALCYVQVPGSWENIQDRGQLQMMGLGIPTISPVMIDQCCDGLLQPNIHYLMCRQDYLDVPDLIRWCDRNRDEAAAMGHNAWLFFQEFCTPFAVWSYIKDRIDNGPRHWRQNIDDDLSPPCLYAPSAQEVATNS